jgi:hypothetical protein
MFDPSVISQIPDSAPNPIAAKAEGFKLADLINTEQLNQLRLNQVKTEQGDQLKMKDILSREDLSTPQGISKAASALTKAGLPEQGMKLMGTAQQYQTGAVEQETAKLQLAAKQTDILAGALDDVYGQLDKLQKAGATPEMLDMRAAQLGGEAIKRLRQQQPDFAQYLDRFSSDPKNLTFAGIKQAETQSNRYQQAMKEKLAERGIEVKEKAEAETERKNKANEALKAAANSDPDPKIGAIYSAMADAGVSFPPGMKSAKVQRETIKGLIAAHPDESPMEIVDRVRSGGLGLAEAKTETTKLAAQKASIDRVERSIADKGGFLDQAESAVKEVDLSKVKSLGKLSNWSKEQMSDPALANYHTRITELRAEYALVLSKGGQITDAARTESEKVIPDYVTPEQFGRIRQAIEQGIQTSRKAIDESLADSTGKKDKPEAAPAKKLTYDPSTGTFK